MACCPSKATSAAAQFSWSNWHIPLVYLAILSSASYIKKCEIPQKSNKKYLEQLIKNFVIVKKYKKI